MVYIDVREKDEYKNERIKDSINIPLSHFHHDAPPIINNLKDSEIVLVCKSGTRANLALNEIKKFHITDKNFQVFEGGINAWKSANKEVICGHSSVIPLIRQMQLGAGFIILSSFILSYFVNPNFVYGALFVGTGLTIAGLTGFCGMIMVLQKMPWNKV